MFTLQNLFLLLIGIAIYFFLGHEYPWSIVAILGIEMKFFMDYVIYECQRGDQPN